jgi:hypothetical protein
VHISLREADETKNSGEGEERVRVGSVLGGSFHLLFFGLRLGDEIEFGLRSSIRANTSCRKANQS